MRQRFGGLGAIVVGNTPAEFGCFIRSIRFTATEIDEPRALGIDLNGVKSPHEFAAAREPWLQALAELRPDLFDRIVREVAATKGIWLPLGLPVVSDLE